MTFLSMLEYSINIFLLFFSFFPPKNGATHQEEICGVNLALSSDRYFVILHTS